MKRKREVSDAEGHDVAAALRSLLGSRALLVPGVAPTLVHRDVGLPSLEVYSEMAKPGILGTKNDRRDIGKLAGGRGIAMSQYMSQPSLTSGVLTNRGKRPPPP